MCSVSCYSLWLLLRLACVLKEVSNKLTGVKNYNLYICAEVESEGGFWLVTNRVSLIYLLIHVLYILSTIFCIYNAFYLQQDRILN